MFDRRAYRKFVIGEAKRLLQQIGAIAESW
jgi:hypothetical protein